MMDNSHVNLIYWAVGLNLTIVGIIATTVYFMVRNKLDCSAFGTFTKGYDDYVKINEGRFTVLLEEYKTIRATQEIIRERVSRVETSVDFQNKQMDSINIHLASIDARMIVLTDGFSKQTGEALSAFKDALDKQISLNEQLIKSGKIFE